MRGRNRRGRREVEGVEEQGESGPGLAAVDGSKAEEDHLAAAEGHLDEARSGGELGLAEKAPRDQRIGGRITHDSLACSREKDRMLLVEDRHVPGQAVGERVRGVETSREDAARAVDGMLAPVGAEGDIVDLEAEPLDGEARRAAHRDHDTALFDETSQGGHTFRTHSADELWWNAAGTMPGENVVAPAVGED